MSSQAPIVTSDKKPASVETAAEQHTLSIYVSNQPGVLARIAQVFSRRAYNIDSLVVSQGRDPAFSRMTVGVSGDSRNLSQIVTQVSKLVDVIHCFDHTPSDSVVKELALVKIRTSANERTDIFRIIDHFEGKTIDLTDHSVIGLLTGDSEKIGAALKALSNYQIIETVRTGKVVMARGEQPT